MVLWKVATISTTGVDQCLVTNKLCSTDRHCMLEQNRQTESSLTDVVTPLKCKAGSILLCGKILNTVTPTLT